MSSLIARPVRRALARIDPIRFIPMLCFAAVFLPYLGFVPLWDGRQYADTLLVALHFPFNPLDFNIFGHPSMLYMGLIALGQAFGPGNVYLLSATNLLIGAFGVACFFAIVQRCFPDSRDRWENLLLAMTFAVYPIVVASQLNLNPDSGVLVFSLALISALLAERFTAAALAACFLVYSKESGILLYILIVGFYLLIFVAVRPGPVREKVRSALKRSRGFAPVGLFLAVTVITHLSARPGWAGATGGSILRDFIVPSFAGSHSAYLTAVWILNFAWIATAVVTAALVVILIRVLSHNARFPSGADSRVVSFLAPLTVAVLYSLTRFQTYANPRYLLPIYPLFLLGFVLSLRILIARRSLRTGLLALFFVAVLASCFRTIDPVSKAVYGTVPFGKHDLLHMTSLTGECCGYGRDQMEYNLEYTKIHSIQNLIFSTIRPGASTTFVIDPLANWFVHGFLDRGTFHRTLKAEGAFRPRYLTADAVGSRATPREIYYVAYPNVDNSGDIWWLRRRYRIDSIRDFDLDGYSIPVIRMTLKTPSVLPTS